jgi:hypothetical protein
MDEVIRIARAASSPASAERQELITLMERARPVTSLAIR